MACPFQQLQSSKSSGKAPIKRALTTRQGSLQIPIEEEEEDKNTLNLKHLNSAILILTNPPIVYILGYQESIVGIHKAYANPRERVTNEGSEDMPVINASELRSALKQMKNRRAPRENRVTFEMLKARGEALKKAIIVLLKRSHKEDEIPDYWRNEGVILVYKKGDCRDINNYRSISLLSVFYKLFIKNITNGLNTQTSSNITIITIPYTLKYKKAKLQKRSQLKESVSFKTWHGDKDVNIDREYLSHLRFADDIVLISSDEDQFEQMIQELHQASMIVGLEMNLNKTKILSQSHIAVTADSDVVESYV
uniref:Reverse transcriptase domain-containing protein n=1 Tax=Dendroctonus ponderosae TaxID=77166 RepID=A0AAR5P8J5_DENPD